MKRLVGCLCLSLVVCSEDVSRAAAPPVAGATRSLSLAEAATRALEHKGYRVERRGHGSLRVVHDSRIDSLEALRLANQTLLNTEVAYWNLYQTRMALSARKQGRRCSRESLRACKSRKEVGEASRKEVAQARSQYESMRTQCRDASEAVADSERQLSALTGLDLDAGCPLRPSDHPTLTFSRPDWEAAMKETLARRPELRMTRNEVFSCQVALLRERAVQGIWQLSDKQVWNAPAKDRPEGSRSGSDAMSSTPPLQMQLAQALEVLKDQEGKAQNFLESYYRRISLNYKQTQATRAQREAFAELLEARKTQYAAGRCSLTALLAAQRGWTDALGHETYPIAAYNNALAGFEYGKGTTLDRHHMVFAKNDGNRSK